MPGPQPHSYPPHTRRGLAEVQFCYQCGKRVGKTHVQCLYCSAPTKRIVRPPRYCPFCEEEVGHNAIKCAHCGEFLDGRASPTHQNMTFHIDKAVISEGGLSLPGQSAGGQLPARTRANWEPNYSDQSSGGTGGAGGAYSPRGALPMPSATDADANTFDAEYEETGRPSRPATAAPAYREGGLAPRRGGGERNQPLAPAATGALRGGGSTALGYPAAPASAPLAPVKPRSFLSKLLHRGGAEENSAALGPALDVASDESRYAPCPNCHTETLATDHYCYHCGQPLRGPNPLLKGGSLPGAVLVSSNLVLLLTAGAFFCAFATVRNASGLSEYNDPVYLGTLAAAGLFLAAWSAKRARGLVHRFVALATFVGGALLMALAY